MLGAGNGAGAGTAAWGGSLCTRGLDAAATPAGFWLCTQNSATTPVSATAPAPMPMFRRLRRLANVAAVRTAAESLVGDALSNIVSIASLDGRLIGDSDIEDDD